MPEYCPVFRRVRRVFSTWEGTEETNRKFKKITINYYKYEKYMRNISLEVILTLSWKNSFKDL